MGESLANCQGWAASTETVPITDYNHPRREYISSSSLFENLFHHASSQLHWSDSKEQKHKNYLFMVHLPAGKSCFLFTVVREATSADSNKLFIDQSEITSLNLELSAIHTWKTHMYHYYVLQGGREPKGRILLSSCDFGMDIVLAHK